MVGFSQELGAPAHWITWTPVPMLLLLLMYWQQFLPSMCWV